MSENLNTENTENNENTANATNTKIEDNIVENKLESEVLIDEAEDDNDIKKSEVTPSFRSNLYEKIDIPLKTMDIIIGFLVVLIIIFVVVGVIQGR